MSVDINTPLAEGQICGQFYDMLVNHYTKIYGRLPQTIHSETKITEMYVHRPNTVKSQNQCNINPRNLFSDVAQNIKRHRKIDVDHCVDTKDYSHFPFMHKSKMPPWWRTEDNTDWWESYLIYEPEFPPN